MYEVGSIILVPQMFLSSRKHSWNAKLAGSRILRAYTVLSRDAGNDDAGTHLVQIVNEPHQIIPLKVQHPLPVFPRIEYVAELIVKVE